MVAKDEQREEVIIDECTEMDLPVLRGPAVWRVMLFDECTEMDLPVLRGSELWRVVLWRRVPLSGGRGRADHSRLLALILANVVDASASSRMAALAISL
jgi:hypothetical protein